MAFVDNVLYTTAGPYENSYTWFEAFIVRSYRDASGKDTANTKEIKAILEERDAHPRVVPGGLLLREKVFNGSNPARTMILGTVANPRAHAGASDVWDVQRNRRADSQEQTHEVVWVPQAEPSSSKEEAKYFMETGSRMGVGFVDALQPGDRVAVLARAQVSRVLHNWLVFLNNFLVPWMGKPCYKCQRRYIIFCLKQTRNACIARAFD